MTIPKPITYPFPTPDHFQLLKMAVNQALELPEGAFNNLHEVQMAASLLSALQKRMYVPRQRMKMEYYELSVAVLAIRNFVKQNPGKAAGYYDAVASQLLMGLEPHLGSMIVIEKKKDHAWGMAFFND